MRIPTPRGPVHLTYCQNVHAVGSAADAARAVSRFLRPSFRAAGAAAAETLAAGLYLSGPAALEAASDPKAFEALESALGDANAVALTANAFPQGDFHADRVKTAVYRPDWTETSRLEHTLRVAGIMARLPAPEGSQSISTLPGSYKGFGAFDPALCARNLSLCAAGLARIESETGRRIVLALEPEPGCVIETTSEWIDFYEGVLLRRSGEVAEDVLRRHLGTCYDVCHQAVEFEDVEGSLLRLEGAGLGIAKMQLSAALELENPADNEAALARLGEFVEPRYLHQVYARRGDGALEFFEDLPLWLERARERDDRSVRCHFHVPIDGLELGHSLRTTRPDLERAIDLAVGRGLVSHLEVETYSWNVMPERRRDGGATEEELVDDLGRELSWARRRVEAAASNPPAAR